MIHIIHIFGVLFYLLFFIIFLYEFELYGRKKKPTDLTPVHFIKLELNDENGQLLSDNF